MPDRPEPLTVRIERVRDQIVLLFGLAMTISSLGFSFLASLSTHGRLVGGGFARLQGLEAAMGLLSAVLAWRGHRRWGARVMAVTLLVVPTVLVMGFDLPYEPALASYVGVILISAVAIGPLEILGTTSLAVILSLLTYSAAATGPLAPEAMLAIVGLLAGTGIVLALLGEGLLRAVHQLEASEAHFHRLSQLDPLTGLGNRREFDQSLANNLPYCSPQRPLALVVMDVDHLKELNDRSGHAVGDTALQTVAEAIRRSTRDVDTCTRIGGDEFAVILSSGGARGARHVAGRIREQLAECATEYGTPVTISLGVAEATQPDVSPEALLTQADAELYAGRAHVRKPVSTA